MRNLTLRQCLSGLLFILFPLVLCSQKSSTSWSCGSDLMLQRAGQNSHWLEKHEHQEKLMYDSFSAKAPFMVGKSLQLVTLPVVVHIVHNNGAENIADAQVLAGIQQLNDAFANMVYYDQGTGTNTMIQFCLAKRTPSDESTSGITRDQSTLTNLTLETGDIPLKNLNRWEPESYINIWLVRRICSISSGCGVAGYAYFPASHGGPEDGIVMEAEYMGASPGGTGVLAHEMGHYLGLYHTFQGGCQNDDCLADGDRVCDTPPDQSTVWVSCSLFVNTCTTDAQSGFSSDQPDMTLNFMDYTDFDCFHDFTSGQSDRMHWHIENVRYSLLESRGCLDLCPSPVAAFFTASATTIDVGQTVTFTNGSTNASTYSWMVDGATFAGSTNASYVFNTAGTYAILLTANSDNPVSCNSETFERVIEVKCPVVADFEVSTETPAMNEAVSISDQSQNATEYEWFLNGVSQGATFTNFTPTSTGVYVIRLEAGNGFCKQKKLIYLSVQNDQECETAWIKTIGIPGVVEGGNNIIRASDGNFYLDGYRGDSILLIKMTPNGVILWTRSFKFTSGTKENISEIIEDSDGNLVGAGLCTTSQYRGFAFKYNPSADQVVWAHEAPLSPQTFYVSLLERSPGGNYLATISYYNSPSPGYGEDANMVEINRNTGLYSGIKWAFSLASGSSESINEMQIKDGNIYTAGRYTYGLSDDGMRGSISKFDLSGNEIWSRMALINAAPFAKIYAPDFAFDGDNMVTVYYGDFNGTNGLTEQFAVSKSDLNGNLVWSKLYTIAGSPQLFAQSIISVSDGYVIMTPNVASNQPGSVFLIKIDKNGEVLWARNYQDMEVFHGEKFLATIGDYLYFIASHDLGDIVVAKLRLSDGLIGDGCQFPSNVTISKQNMAPVFNPVSLLRYPAPITQNTRTAIPQIGDLSPEDICITACSSEICNNGIDDDGDGLFDCLDPECDCTGCDGEQTRFWYFGDSGGLDFGTDPPTVLSDGQTFSREASSIATDMMGNLLFYTDGVNLYTRTHTLMPNGSNLDGHASTTQTLILPQPDNPWRFFVFTPNSFDNLASGKGLSYSIVDMSLNGSLGDIEASQKNIQLLPQSQFTEKITATRHCNGKDWWVLVKERSNNVFRAYPLTMNGLGAPVVSNVGTVSTVAAPNVVGALKFSPNGKKVANTLFHTGGFDLFDFDNSTGLLSNPASVINPLMTGAYGLEFSSDDQVMYLTNLNAPSHIWQFNPHAGDAGMVAQSAVILAEFDDSYRFGQLQRAPNEKIYVTNTLPLQFTSGIGIIHRPEVSGTGCLYQHEGLNIAPGGANLGLPSFPQDFLPKRLFAAIEGSDSLCQIPGNLSFSININDRCVLDSVRWALIGSGTIVSQDDEGVEINFAQAGTGMLVARAFSVCATVTDTLQIQAFENNTPVLELGLDIQICENGVQVLDAGSGFERYRWNDGSTEATVTTLFPGTYWVDVWDACGNQQSDSIHISVLPSTILDLGADQLICSNATLTYNLPQQFTSWTWTPSTGLDCNDCETIEVSPGETMTYIAVASNGESCLSADTLTISFITDTIFASLDTSVCSGETLLLFGQELPADTTVTFYSLSAGGCDSVLTVTVSGLTPVQTFIEESICSGDTLFINHVQVTGDTTLQFLLAGVNGCDSLVEVNVTLIEPPARALTLEACPGSNAVYNGVEIPIGETRIIRVPSGITGTCDSMITVTAIAAALAPSVELPATDTLRVGSTIQLDPVVSGTQPFLWQWAPSPPPDWLSCYDCPNPIASPLASIVYTVTVTDANGCEAQDSIRLVVLHCAEVYTPNVFSPNNDSVNDWFYFLSEDCPIRIHYLRIFNRWGGMVFERKDFPTNIESLGWDGNLKGKPLTSNVFVWIAEIEFPDGSVVLKTGDVTLLR